MKHTRQQRIRETLLGHPEGLSAQQISQITGMHISNVRTALKAIIDVYVDRWQRGRRGAFEKIFVAVPIPEDCPHPRDKIFKGGRGCAPKTQWRFPVVFNAEAKK